MTERLRIRSGVWFGTPDWLARVRAETDRCRYPRYELSMHGDPGRESFFTAVRQHLPQDPVLVSSLSWDALLDSVRNGFHEAKGNRFVVVWPDLGQAPPFAVEMLDKVVWHVAAGRKYLCVYAEQNPAFPGGRYQPPVR
ncbi:hypothetical protein [Crossiella cryophila]|uniref:Uncharacterized protein n=1 Tax=Crossiella cryophila TaxID=43355 RepID=A0A7W7CE61_9PSEU|nr:hypothetical protein [Crossiella cryophila]MBB4678241.1 hypothetical protein [Crossiella cryophila]